MITELNAKEDQFMEILDGFYQSIQNPSKIRAKAWDHFKTLKLPERKSDNFRYVSLRKLFEKEFEVASPDFLGVNEVPSGAILPECEESFIVLVNGRFSEKLSNTKGLSPRIVMTSLNQAESTYSSFLTNHAAKTLKEESDPFAALNTALYEEGLFIYIPPKMVVEKPIQILHLIDTQNKPLMLNPRVQVFAGAESQAEFISSQKVLSGNHYFVNHVSDFVIEENAHLRYTEILNEVADVWHLNAVRANLKKNSSFHTFAVTNGSQTVRTDYKVSLSGENGECSLNGLAMLEGNREFHTHIVMDHKAPFCRSRQFFKNVLDDFSKSSFEGKILVRQAAQKTDAFQLNNNLMLNDYTNAYSKPNLEIFADDVKASHGATFGQLNAEQLFCLKSRGITDFEAKNLLVFGFCQEIIDLITLPSLQKMLTEQAKKYKN